MKNRATCEVRSGRGQSTVEYLVVATAILLVVIAVIVPRIAGKSQDLMNTAIDTMDGGKP